jgi:hypothetical protein
LTGDHRSSSPAGAPRWAVLGCFHVWIDLFGGACERSSELLLQEAQQAKREGRNQGGEGRSLSAVPVTPTWTKEDFPDQRCVQIEHPEMYLKLEPTTNPNQHRNLLSGLPASSCPPVHSCGFILRLCCVEFASTPCLFWRQEI